MEQRRNWADPGRGEEIVYMGGPRIAHCKDYKTFFMASPEQTKKKSSNREKKKKSSREISACCWWFNKQGRKHRAA